MSGKYVALDVGYRGQGALGAAIVFDEPSTADVVEQRTVQIDVVGDYISGQFYRKELDCLLKVLDQLSAVPQIIIIDGYVTLAEQAPGLGLHLWAALDQQCQIIGVAKSAFRGADHAMEVLRGG